MSWDPVPTGCAVILLVVLARSPPAPPVAPVVVVPAAPVVVTIPPIPIAVPSAEPARQLAPVVSIDDLDDIVKPSTPVTTALLGERSQRDLAPRRNNGVWVTTTCGDRWCVDGATDVATRRAFVPAALDADDREVVGATSHSLERVIRVAFAAPDAVSLYIAETESSGGAHSNNSLTCRTFDRHTGRELQLGDVVGPAAAKRILASARALTDEETALQTVGAMLFLDDAVFSERSFRWGSTESRGRPELVLCGESGRGSATIHELSVDDLPVLDLLR